MHSSLMLEHAEGVKRSVATAFLCGFCGALAGAGLSLLFDSPWTWVAGSLVGAGLMALLGWHYQVQVRNG